MPKILLTGGGGRLGTELRSLIPSIIAPPRAELDVTDAQQVHDVFEREQPDVVVHAAAYTNVGLAEKERDNCWRVNVEGTRNVARAARQCQAKLIHISTDYVFSGDEGNYSEEDTPGPPSNYYALTKLVAEESARIAQNLLIIRTSFRPREFQYPVAFSDVYTSQDYIDIIAPMLAQAILNVHLISDEIIHIVTERKSVFELARRRNPSVQEGKKADVKVILPSDVSLNTQRWKSMQVDSVR